MKKKTKKQIDEVIRRKATEYEQWCQMQFEDKIFEIKMECCIDENEARDRLGELV